MAVQARTIVYEPVHEPGVVPSAIVTVALEQLSVAVTAAGAGMLSQLTVTLAGHPTITGGSLSSTVMIWMR
jgi:hypothetical protein